MQNLHRQVEKQLGEADLRFTRGRQTVVETLAKADGPMSAGELKETLGPQVPLSSLYRSLAVLEQAGVVIPHLGVKEMARYELAEWLTGHHHHLICIDCGAVEDVAMDDSEEAAVNGVVSQAGSRAGFTPVSHALEIEGRCARCS